MTKKAVSLIGWIVLTSLSGPVYADKDGEREALARLTHEIEALAPIIESAEMQAEVSERIRFQYPWLKKDLERIKLGIREHLEAPRAEPRTFPPLQGDYRR